jgi:hypothetical protein
MLRIIVAGSRTFKSYDFLEQEVLKIVSKFSGEEIEIVSGNAIGADKLGERFAKKYGIPLRLFPANWSHYGKKAGYIRNKAMAEYSDVLIAFWDGRSRGTMLMYDLAKKNNLEVFIFENI